MRPTPTLHSKSCVMRARQRSGSVRSRMRQGSRSMTRPRVAVFASGGGTNFENLVRKQDEIGIDIVLLISDYNEAYAIQRAINHDVDYIVVEREKYATKAEFESDILSVMKMYNIEYILLAGFMRILSADFVDKYPRKIINIHPSLLPDF